MKTTLLALACALPLSAQSGNVQVDSARAAAVVARHMTAVGGVAALAAVKEYHVVMSATIPGPDAREARTETYVKAPNLLYMKMDMPFPGGALEMGFDGTTAWGMSAAAGPMILDEVPKQLSEAANFGKLPFDGARLSYLGSREIGGRALEAVRAEFAEGQVTTNYFDVKSGLYVGMDIEGAPRPPAGRVNLAFDDYKRFGTVLQATRMTTTTPDGREMVMRILSVSYGPIESKVFEMPPAVRALRNQPAGAKKP